MHRETHRPGERYGLPGHLTESGPGKIKPQEHGTRLTASSPAQPRPELLSEARPMEAGQIQPPEARQT